MDTRFKKMIVKGIVGLASTALIGFIYKTDKRVAEAIDRYFDAN